MKIVMEDGSKNNVDSCFKKYLCRRPAYNPEGVQWFEDANKKHPQDRKPAYTEGEGELIAVTPFTGLKIEDDRGGEKI